MTDGQSEIFQNQTWGDPPEPEQSPPPCPWCHRTDFVYLRQNGDFYCRRCRITIYSDTPAVTRTNIPDDPKTIKP